MNWYLEVLRKYAVFSGRAQRKEYWFFVLFNLIIYIVLAIIDGSLSTTNNTGWVPLRGLYSLAVLIPGIAVAVRRLHDTGRSGWYLFVSLIPFVGSIILLFILSEDGEYGKNQYGPDPKEYITNN